MTDTDRIDQQWNILRSTQDAIRFSDTKAMVLISAYGIIGTLSVDQLSQLFVQVAGDLVPRSLLIGGVVLLLVSAVFCFRCLAPRFRPTAAHSLTYFGAIQKDYPTAKDYANKWDVAERGAIASSLSEEIHAASMIAWSKFTDLNRSIKALYLGCALLLIAYALHVLQATVR